MIETTYEYIHFVKVDQKTKTSVWECRNNKSYATLGVVKWYPAWRAYCFFSGPAIYNKGCLEHIISFIDDLNEERRRLGAEGNESHPRNGER